MTDAERLHWYQEQHTLHFSLEFTYAVDHYELAKVNESERTVWVVGGETLAECIDNGAVADTGDVHGS